MGDGAIKGTEGQLRPAPPPHPAGRKEASPPGDVLCKLRGLKLLAENTASAWEGATRTARSTHGLSALQVSLCWQAERQERTGCTLQTRACAC